MACGLKVGMGSSAENILISPGERLFPRSILHCLCLGISFWLRQLLNKSFTVTAVLALNVHPILHRKTGSLWQLFAAALPFAITSTVPSDSKQRFASWHLATYLNMETTGSYGVFFGRDFISSS